MAKLQKYALMALKKKSPKVPNYTCTDIDNIITTLGQLHEKDDEVAFRCFRT
jgi:hypothetical protein